MALVDRFRELERQLPDDWETARLRLNVPDDGDCARAAALLGPLNPGRRGKLINFTMTHRGGIAGEDRVASLLRRLDGERIDGELELVGSDAAAEDAVVEAKRFVPAWEAELARLPADWTDLYAEVELASSDYLERAALLLAPVNPSRYGGKPGFRFRVSQRFGYGASTQMAHRCLERLDAEGTRGSVRVLWALSDTKPVQTQGPVWYVGGRSV